ncbi:MAG: TetR family transcriptional regulator [Rhodobacterales bacterium 32-66-7]|nr:MAG: TetR family transcriptional regulator [Rhodobacterales bacterium 12-65-15]OYX22759.1 MAG: TetR family transcriptional regulator [Rhodobacterales bacterium 32-66-7]
MQPTVRRPFRRETEETRRADLIAATQVLVAEGGTAAATVRAIAARAGVTAGLIRHYFQSKEDLVRAAYLALMQGMTVQSAEALETVGAGPEERLAAFIATSLRPPVMEAGAVGLWAGYMHKVQSDPELLAVHEAVYLDYRGVLQSLIAALPRDATLAQLRAEAIACNAVIDGLWLEGSILAHAFAPAEPLVIGLRSIGAILGLDLLAHAPPPFDPGKALP